VRLLCSFRDGLVDESADPSSAPFLVFDKVHIPQIIGD
jgi:hypothetical protein